MKKLISSIVMVLGMAITTGCQSTYDETRQLAPEGDSKITQEMTDHERASYNMGMADSRGFLKSNNNKMNTEDVFQLLNEREKSGTVDIDSYFKGVSYYLILIDKNGNELKDNEVVKELKRCYNQKMTSDEGVEKNDKNNKPEKTKQVLSQDIAIDKLYIAATDIFGFEPVLSFYDNEENIQVIKADIIEPDTGAYIGFIQIDLTTGKIHYKQEQQ